MCQYHIHRIYRRDFLKAGGIALGATVSAMACRGSVKIAGLTAVPTQPEPISPVAPVLSPGEAADTIIFNGNIVTMNATILGPQAIFASMGVTTFQDVYARS